MAINNITFNPNILALYQTFYNNKQVDMTESLAWFINDEKSIGVSEEQGNMIIHFAHFYFEVIQLLRQVNTPTWEYLDWLTQDEYDSIIYKREILEY